VGIIFGSDVIYDNDFTDALFAVLKTLLRGGITFLLALEKRFNFSVEEQDVTAQAYDYFKQYFIIEGEILCHFVLLPFILLYNPHSR